MEKAALAYFEEKGVSMIYPKWIVTESFLAASRNLNKSRGLMREEFLSRMTTQCVRQKQSLKLE